MGDPFTIQIFYPDGDPENMRIVTQRGWTGKVFHISRKFWTKAADRYREELGTPGIYVLTGKNEEFEEGNDDIQSIYIGQAENLHQRIEQHINNPEKSFFQSVTCVAESGDFNNAHFKWMESDLIEKAKEIDRCILQNGNTPQKPQIGEPETVDTCQFLGRLLQMFSVVGIDAFVKPKTIDIPTYSPSLQSQTPTAPTSEEMGQQETQGHTRLPSEELHEIKNKILAAFQKKENTVLFKRSSSTFYDESRQIRVCLSISKSYGEAGDARYWFVFHENWRKFLKEGKKGFVIWGMAEQSKAVVMSFEGFEKILDNFNKDESRGRWHIIAKEKNGKISFNFRGRAEDLDLSKYLIDID